MQKNEKKHEHSSTYHLCKCTLMVCALIAAGCTQQNSGLSSLKTQGNGLYVEADQDISTADIMEVAEDVLAGMHFTIEKADVDNGLIRTRPLPGAQFFEFWRSDNIGADNAFAANLHTIRRTVILNISPKQEQLQIACEVQIQRLSMPERQVSSSGRIYRTFSRSDPLLLRLILNPEQKKEMDWIDLGRDARLETEILRRIEVRMVRQTSQKLQKTEKKT